VAFFIAAGTDSRCSVRIPEVSSAVMKNFIGGSGLECRSF
jgi:hypothetical protein